MPQKPAVSRSDFSDPKWITAAAIQDAKETLPDEQAQNPSRGNH